MRSLITAANRGLRSRAVWVLVALVAVLFWRPLTFETFYFRDLYLLFYPKKLLFANAVRGGTLPLWDPTTNGGQPYLVEPANYAFHPINVLYLILPTIDAFNWMIVLNVLAAALFSYWAARTIGLRTEGAFVAAVVYAFSGFTLSTLNLFPWFLGLVWVPLAIGLLHRAIRDDRSIAPPAIAAAMPLYSGAAEVAAILCFTMIVWAWVMRGPKGLKRALVTVAFSAGLAALPTLPATSVIAQSSRHTSLSYQVFSSWSVHPFRLPELIVPQFFGSLDTFEERGYWGRAYEFSGFPYILSLYFGIPALVLAGLGMFARTDESEAPRRTLGAIACVAFLLSLGKWLPWFHLLYQLPFVATFRYPVKAIGAAIFPIAILAGCGVAHLTRKIAASAVIGLSAVALASIALAPVPLTRGLAHVVIVSIALFVAAFLPRRREQAIAAIVALDLVIAGASVNSFASRSFYDEPPIARTVRSLVGNGRFYAASTPMVLHAPTNERIWRARWHLALLSDYSAATFGIPVIFHIDYDGLAPLAIARISEAMNRLPWPQRIQLMNTANVSVFSAGERLTLSNVEEVASQRDEKLHLYVNHGASAARFVGPCNAERADLLRRTMNSVTYEVVAPCAGTLHLSETFYDGWQTTIDGRETRAYRSRYAYSAVPVPAGRHIIERRYFPPRLIAGAVITILAALLLAVLRL